MVRLGVVTLQNASTQVKPTAAKDQRRQRLERRPQLSWVFTSGGKKERCFLFDMLRHVFIGVRPFHTSRHLSTIRTGLAEPRRRLLVGLRSLRNVRRQAQKIRREGSALEKKLARCYGCIRFGVVVKTYMAMSCQTAALVSSYNVDYLGLEGSGARAVTLYAGASRLGVRRARVEWTPNT